MTASSRPPNVLWIFCDQLRWHALGSSGDPNIRTPHIDRIGAEGARCTLACSQYPVCTPFRAGLITGQHGHITGVRVHGDLLDPSRRTIAHTFRAGGYRTAWIGKWHLASVQGAEGWRSGGDYWVHPLLRGGFEDFAGFDASNHAWNTRYCTGDRIYPPIPLPGYQTDGLTELSLDWLDQHGRGDRPWFHCLSVEAPHPLTDHDGSYGHPTPPEWRTFIPGALTLRGNVPAKDQAAAREKLSGYYAQIANLDHNVGRLLAWLDASGQAERTLVVFFADHGEMGYSHGRIEKMSIFDESIRIPLLWRLPGSLPAGTVVDCPINGLDLFPTTAALCSLPIPPEVQGRDLSAVLAGDPRDAPHETLIQWLGPARYGFADFRFRAIRTRRFTYCRGDPAEHDLLWDNERDPLQSTNAFNDPGYADERRDLQRRLESAVLRSGEALPGFVTAERT
ncbi:acetylglucosamine-6-sulfatase [Planctomycetota bacterium]|nr:acetylglucosamine-6-sulfatase [Planctomycetota bacterium]